MKIITISFTFLFFIFGILTTQESTYKQNTLLEPQISLSGKFIYLSNHFEDFKTHKNNPYKSFYQNSDFIKYKKYNNKYIDISVDSLFLKKFYNGFASGQDNTIILEPEKLNDKIEKVKPEYTFMPEYNPLKRFGNDLWRQATSPFRMKGSDFIWFGAGTMITAGLLLTDQQSYKYIKDGTKKTKVFRDSSPELTEFGANYGLITLGAFAGYSVLFSDHKAQETSFLALESFLTSSLWVVSIKWLAGRERPSAQENSGSKDGGKWYGPVAYLRSNPKKSISNFDAFPSGHTATAFSIATVIAKQYDNTIYVPLLSYAAATIVGITRIGESTHWASDVFVGAVIGYLCATQVVHDNPSEYTRYHKIKNKQISKIKTDISFGLYENSPALFFRASF